MNILLMSRILAKTGVGNHIKLLSKELVNQGHKVVVVSSTNELNIGENDGVDFRCVELRSSNPLILYKSLKALKNIIKENSIEIVHCHHRKASLVMALYNFVFKKIPYIWTLHLAPIPCDFIHKSLTFYGNSAIAVSQGVAKFLRDSFKVPNEKIKIVLNGVDNGELKPVSNEEKITLREKYGISRDKIVICLHSRIDHVKNHLAVVQAVAMLSENEKDKFIILCSGEQNGDYYQKLIKEIDRLNINGNFVFCGWSRTSEVLGASDILLLPSYKEGFGLNCVEAMFMNVPVVRSKTAGYEDMEEACILLEDVTPQTISKHITAILQGTEFEEQAVINAKRFAEEKFTVQSMARSTVDVYREVLNKNR